MKMQACLVMTLLLLTGNGVPIQAKEDEQIVHLSVYDANDSNVTCNKAVYEVYQDDLGTIPFCNASGDIYSLETNEQGYAEGSLPNAPFFLKCQTPALGYYGDSQVYEGKNEMTIQEWPIHISIQSDKRSPTVHYKQTDGTFITDKELQAGQKVIAYEIPKTNGYAMNPIEIDIPLYRDEEKDVLSYETNDLEYGTISLSFVEGEQAVKQVKYEIYQDQECTKSLPDVFGREWKENIDGTVQEIPFLPGDWYLKIVSVPHTYLLPNKAIPFTVKEKEQIELKCELEKTNISVKVIDAETKEEVDTNVSISLVEDKTNTVIERNKSYLVQVIPVKDGYFEVEPKIVLVPEDASEVVQVCFEVIPFTIRVYGKDNVTSNEVDMKYEMHNSQGEVITKVKAGDTVFFHETSVAEGYDGSQDQTLSIPKMSDTAQKYEVCFTHVPYVNTVIYGLTNTKIGLYSDEACTQTAFDKDGNVAQGYLQDTGLLLQMRNGTYFVKQLSTIDGYAIDTNVYTIVCNHEESLQIVFRFGIHKIGFSIITSFPQGEETKVVYDILENDQVIGQLDGQSEDWYRTGIYAGHTYEVQVHQVDGMYSYIDTQSITIGENGFSTGLSFTFVPYGKLMITSNSDKSIQAVLYDDQQGIQKTKDVSGHFCDLNLSSAQEISLAPGTYWLRSESTSHYYAVCKEIVVKQGQQKEFISLKPVSVVIETNTADTQNGVMELVDEQGKLIKTWNRDTDMETDQLEPGKNYVIRNTQTKEEQNFTMPITEPEEKPIVRMDSVEEVSESKQPVSMFVWVGGIGLLLVCLSIGVFFYHRNEKGFKE